MSFLFDQVKQTAAQLDALAKSSGSPDAELVHEVAEKLMEPPEPIDHRIFDPKILEAFEGLSAADLHTASETEYKA